jgi:hypothetical protein
LRADLLPPFVLTPMPAGRRLNMPHLIPKRTTAFLSLCALVMLYGCGGGGGDNGGGAAVIPPPPPPPTAPGAPVLSLELQPIKIFRFNWSDVTGETEYRLLENPDGSAGYAPVATLPAGSETHDHAVFLPARVNASYILDACNDAGCTSSAPVFVEGELVEAIGYLKASNTDAGDRFGFSVALSGEGATLAVGANHEDSAATGIGGDQNDNSANNSGAVYVFTRDAGAWSQQAYVKASNTGANDDFGWSVALSNDGATLAVGARSESSAATGIGGDQNDNSAGNSGAVYVLTREAGEWSQQAYVKASNTGADDRFGSSVSLSNDGATLAVGAPDEQSAATGLGGDQNDNSVNNSGAVYVFTREAGEWSQQAYVKASNTGADDQFGWAVALSGDGATLAVGAWGEASAATGIGGDQDDNSESFSGAVYVFTRNADDWSQQAYVKASNTDALDRFGQSVALSDDGATLAIGASGEASAAIGVGGDQDDNSAPLSGAVYMLTREAGEWSHQAYVKASNTGAFDQFGNSVALSADGATLAVGAYIEYSAATGIGGDQDDNSVSFSGAVYVFTLDAGAWSQQAYVKASNTGREDLFGASVALSGEGTTLAVGAWGEDSAATGTGGDQSDNSANTSGAVYLY